MGEVFLQLKAAISFSTRKTVAKKQVVCSQKRITGKKRGEENWLCRGRCCFSKAFRGYLCVSSFQSGAFPSCFFTFCNAQCLKTEPFDSTGDPTTYFRLPGPSNPQCGFPRILVLYQFDLVENCLRQISPYCAQWPGRRVTQWPI